MKRISIQDLKARLSGVVAEAESGRTILITRHNEPVARLSPAGQDHVFRGKRVGTGRIRPALRGGTRGRFLAVLMEDRGGPLSPDAIERPPRRRLYVDTSAYLCILLADDGADRLSGQTANAELLSSVLLMLEAKRNLIRLAREGTLNAEDYKTCMDRVEEDTERFVLRDLTLDLCGSSPFPAVVTPRSLDLAHLRTALWFHARDEIERFVTIDAAQAHAAREMGLPV